MRRRDKHQIEKQKVTNSSRWICRLDITDDGMYVLWVYCNILPSVISLTLMWDQVVFHTRIPFSQCFPPRPHSQALPRLHSQASPQASFPGFHPGLIPRLPLGLIPRIPPGLIPRILLGLIPRLPQAYSTEKLGMRHTDLDCLQNYSNCCHSNRVFTLISE